MNPLSPGFVRVTPRRSAATPARSRAKPRYAAATPDPSAARPAALRFSARPLIAPLAAALLLAVPARAGDREVCKEVEKVLAGGSPDKEARRVFRTLHEQWLESERAAAQPGDQSLGRALKALSQGRIPGEADLAALANAYFRGRRERDNQPVGPPAHDSRLPTPVPAGGPPSHALHWTGGLLLAFALGSAAGLLAFFLWQRFRRP